jgi:RHS repeat-associated protein
LPQEVTFAGGNTVTYGYDASGSKLSVTYQTGGTTIKTEYMGNKVYNNGTLSMVLTEEGYLTLPGTTPAYHYYLKDHQGNNRVVIDQGGTVQQVNHYYPFGGLFGEGMQLSNQPYKYNGKELDRKFGLDLYDYGARHYDAALGWWFTMDPLAEKYYSISPYAYCGNNPVRFTDPTGMVIDSLSQADWDKQKNTITAQRDKLVEKNKNGKNDARIASINGTLNNMTTLEGSDQVYSLQSVDGNKGQLRFDPATGNIVIEYYSTDNFVHEVTHGAQFESGNIGFSTQTGMVIGNDLWDEAAAYTAQFNYSTSSIGGVSNASQITPQWVSNITVADGSKPYGPGGAFNVGQRVLNANSTMTSAYLAYPHLRQQIISSGSLLNQVPFRNYPNYRFK